MDTKIFTITSFNTEFKNMPASFDNIMKPYLLETPFIYILRGVHPHQIPELYRVLTGFGKCCIEITMDSEYAEECLKILGTFSSEKSCIGAGTVLTETQLNLALKHNIKFILSPLTDKAIVEKAISRNKIVLPGIKSIKDAEIALNAGAQALKIFPAKKLGLDFIEKLKTVTTDSVPLIPVGGIEPDSLLDYQALGIKWFGAGTYIFKPNYGIEKTSQAVLKLMNFYKQNLDYHIGKTNNV